MSLVLIEKAMEAEGIQPNEKFYSAVIRATGEGGRSDMTLQLLQEMKRLGMKPGVRTFNTAVWACSKVDAVLITGVQLVHIEGIAVSTSSTSNLCKRSSRDALRWNGNEIVCWIL